MEHIAYANLTTEEQQLLEKAKHAGEQYFNKNSTRRVGAALLCSNNKIYQGASIRRTNVSNSTCAERMALDKAIFDKCFEYKMLAVVGFFDGDRKDIIVPPCGLCRQILSEAEDYNGERKKITLLLSNRDFTDIIKTNSQELFPVAYQGREYK